MEMKKVRLGDIGNIITGSTPSKKNPDNYGNYALWIKPTDINPEEKYTRVVEEMFSEKAAKDCQTRLIPAKSICVPCIGTVGTKLTMTPCDCFTNQSINSIIPNEEYDNDYVYYLLLNFLPNLKSINKGTASGRDFIAKSAFEDIEIMVHKDLKNQQIIGKILSAYDDIIDNCKRQIALLEEAAQRLYREWFIDMRFPSYESTSYAENGLPEDWELLNIGSVCDIKTGKKDANFGGSVGLYPFFTCAQEPIRANSFSFDTHAIILAGNGDFSVKMYRGKFEAYQRTYVITSTNTELIWIAYFSIKNNMAKLTAGASGSTIKFLTKGMIEEINCIKPSSSIISKFNVIVSTYYEQIEKIKDIKYNITEIKNIILPRLISGQIEINE